MRRWQTLSEIKELADAYTACNVLACDKVTGNYKQLRRDISRCTYDVVDPFSLISAIEGGVAEDGDSLNFKARRVSLTKLRESEFAVSNPSPFRD